jgi:hypothetical protein
MKQQKYICFEFMVPASLPYVEYRSFIKRALIRRFPGLIKKRLMHMIEPYHPEDLNNVLGVVDGITLEVAPPCGCRSSFDFMDVPFEDLGCPCGKSTYFKFTKC